MIADFGLRIAECGFSKTDYWLLTTDYYEKMSTIIDIAEAVAAELNAAEPGTFSQDFTARRKVIPAYKLEELNGLKVSVVPRGVEITSSTRAGSQYDFALDIGIQKRIGRDVDTDVQALIVLVDEIADFLQRRPLAAAPFVKWLRCFNDPIYVPEHLTEQRTFTSVLTLTYRAVTA